MNKLDGHSRFVTSCAFSPDNRLLATGSNDKSVIVWMIDQRRANGTLSHVAANTEKSIAAHSRCDILLWTVDDVLKWLHQLGLHTLGPVFRENRIDGSELLHLTHDSLQNVLKVHSFGDRNKILRSIMCMCTAPHLSIPYRDNPSVLPELLCPITCEVMRDPVVAADGFSYEKSAILTWIGNGKCTSPMTNEPLDDLNVRPNRTLALLIMRLDPAASSAYTSTITPV